MKQIYRMKSGIFYFLLSSSSWYHRFQNFKRKKFNSYSKLLDYTLSSIITDNLTISFAIYFTNPGFYRVTSNYNDISWSRELLCFKQICLSIVRLFFVSPLPYTVSIYISRSKTHVLQLRSESVRFWFSSGYINNLIRFYVDLLSDDVVNRYGIRVFHFSR